MRTNLSGVFNAPLSHLRPISRILCCTVHVLAMLEANQRPEISIAGASVEAKDVMFVSECRRCLSLKKSLPGIIVVSFNQESSTHAQTHGPSTFFLAIYNFDENVVKHERRPIKTKL